MRQNHAVVWSWCAQERRVQSLTVRLEIGIFIRIPAAMRYEYIELILQHRNNWIFQRLLSTDIGTRANVAERIASTGSGVHRALAQLGQEGWQVTQVLECESRAFGSHRLYFLQREIID